MYKTITRSRITYFKEDGDVMGILKKSPVESVATNNIKKLFNKWRKNNGTSTNDTSYSDINSLYLGNQ